jgi:galactosamine-6-phosphate isomerase/glucosamine-6-phosphate deaminase
MRAEVFADAAAVAEAASRHLADALTSQPRGLFCLAAGDTPKLTYEGTVARLKAEGFDPSGLKFVALDEWRGLTPDAPGGCRAFLWQTIFGPLGVNPSQVAFFDALAPDAGEECRRIDGWIAEHGPIAMAVLGVGMNGHLGFNEPGTGADSVTRPVELDATTRRVGAKYFPDGRAPSQGLTLGLATLLRAQAIEVLATGAAKSLIVAAALDAARFPDVPAAVLHRHGNVRFLVDSFAAGEAPPA